MWREDLSFFSFSYMKTWWPESNFVHKLIKMRPSVILRKGLCISQSILPWVSSFSLIWIVDLQSLSDVILTLLPCCRVVRTPMVNLRDHLFGCQLTYVLKLWFYFVFLLLLLFVAKIQLSFMYKECTTKACTDLYRFFVHLCELLLFFSYDVTCPSSMMMMMILTCFIQHQTYPQKSL